MRSIVLMLLLAPLMALAQTASSVTPPSPKCLPWPAPAASTGWVGTPIYTGMSKNGAWAFWHCGSPDGQSAETYEYVATVAELSKVGGRLQTIINAADPLTSLQTAYRRFTILPLNDPSLAAIVADMRAAQGK